MEQQIQELQMRVNKLEGLLYKFALTDRYMFSRNLQIQDGRSVTVGTTTGARIGTAATEKISVYGVTPVIQASAISAPSGGGTQDAEARTAINSIRTALTNFGITA